MTAITIEFLQSLFADRAAKAPFIEAIENPKNRWDRFEALREFYARTDTGRWDPYPVDWMKVFTPIERMVWGDLRNAGVNMWPQYPVGSRFMDFADPKRRIAIECDGKDWHDREKDAERDAELGSLGWTVFRLTGADCTRTLTPDEDADTEDARTRHELWRWLCHTSEGLVEAIAVHYYGRKSYYASLEDVIRVLEMRSSKNAPFVNGETGTTAY